MMPTSGQSTSPLSVVGLFAGIGGLELGFQRSGHETRMLCEVWEPAQDVLRARFPDVPLKSDIRDLRSLPASDVVTAGFPCTDLSQAGRTAGITGSQSGLVSEVFRLLRRNRATWLVLENVRNMLALDGGRAMTYLVDELEAMGYRWAYRLVDSRSAGVPQRRQRVFLVASRKEDPRGVLFADESGEPSPKRFQNDAFGFYWTEGYTGLGWAKDAVPPLKGGSTVGIPSPPAVWLPGNEVGHKIVLPSLGDGERLQGFPRGWLKTSSNEGRRNSPGWKLVGNAVTVGVAAWLGSRLSSPGSHDPSADLPLGRSRWPHAAWGDRRAGRKIVEISMWPESRRYRHLTSILDPNELVPLSERAAQGFLSRVGRSRLRFDEDFVLDLKEHVDALTSVLQVRE
jgi:DNA (cytosine-5)-methyltransferase 1